MVATPGDGSRATPPKQPHAPLKAKKIGPPQHVKRPQTSPSASAAAVQPVAASISNASRHRRRLARVSALGVLSVAIGVTVWGVASGWFDKPIGDARRTALQDSGDTSRPAGDERAGSAVAPTPSRSSTAGEVGGPPADAGTSDETIQPHQPSAPASRDSPEEPKDTHEPTEVDKQTEGKVVKEGPAPAASSADDPSHDGYFRFGKPQRVEVTHRSVVQLDGPARAVKVFHVKPVTPRWYGEEGPYLADVQLTPRRAREEVVVNLQRAWPYWSWQQWDADPETSEFERSTQGYVTDTLVFESRYTLVVASRELQVDDLALTWEQVEEAGRVVPRHELDEPIELPDEVRQTALEIKGRYSNPLEAVKAMSRWIKENIEYDESVEYGFLDLSSIFQHRKGDCGRRFTVLRAFCQAAGIPCRLVYGFWLANQEGTPNIPSLGKVGRDWNHGHAWAEIYLPQAGWVEVEPAAGDACFAIPSHYVTLPRGAPLAQALVLRGGAWSDDVERMHTVRVAPSLVPGWQKSAEHESSPPAAAPEEPPHVAREKEDFAFAFQFWHDADVTAAGVNEALEYLSGFSADPELVDALDAVCPPNAVRLPTSPDELAAAIAIDGKDDDWARIPIAVKDEQGNVTAKEPMDEAPDGLDIDEVSYLCTNRDLFLRLKLHGGATSGGVVYWFQISDDRGAPTYALAFSRENGAWLRRYENGQSTQARLPEEKCAWKIGDILEARVSRLALLRLSDRFPLRVTSRSRATSHANWLPQFTAQSARIWGSTPAAYLLARYAEEIDLKAAGLLPLAACLTESLAFENADPDLRDTIVADGVAMITAGQELDEHLRSLPLEALIAWCSRSMLWSVNGPLLNENGRISREGYEFMFLDPRILPEVRAHLHSQGINVDKRGAELAAALKDWATKNNRYRWKLDELETWAEELGGDWPRIYQETADDIQAGRDKLCTIDGWPIYFHSVSSANFNWRWYREHGYFYGCCGDVSVMEMLAYKALGVPDVCFHNRLGPQNRWVHTFAGYFDRDQGKWRSPQFARVSLPEADDPILFWYLPPLSARFVQSHEIASGDRRERFVSQRAPLLNMPLGEMRGRLRDGFDQGDFRRLLYGQLEDVPLFPN